MAVCTRDQTRSLEEIDEMFVARVPPREFGIYQCQSGAFDAEKTVDGKTSVDEECV